VRELRYTAPASLAEAVSLLSDAGQDPRILAGGTDLLIQLRAGVRDAGHLVDVKRIPELNVLEASPEDGLRVGAAVPCASLVEHAAAGELYPGLVEAAALIGSTQIQSRATLAGNLCNGSPAADTTPALLALDATCVTAGPGGSRTRHVSELLVGPGRTSLEPREILVEIRVAAPAKGAADAYQRLIPRGEMDIAVVGVGAVLQIADGRVASARIALGAVGPTALLAEEAAASLVGKAPDEAALERAGALATAAARPISDKRGSAEYRRDVVSVLTRRVLASAIERARRRA